MSSTLERPVLTFLGLSPSLFALCVCPVRKKSGKSKNNNDDIGIMYSETVAKN